MDKILKQYKINKYLCSGHFKVRGHNKIVTSFAVAFEFSFCSDYRMRYYESFDWSLYYAEDEGLLVIYS